MLDGLTLSESARKSLETATAAYAVHVDQVAAYLVGRGIGRQAAVSFRLGAVAQPEPGHERFAGMLSIPYVTDAGVVAIKFRRLDGDGPKYDGPAGQGLRLFNARACAADSDVIAVCEGELDAIKVQQDLGIPAVGTPGTQWQPHWSRCLSDFDRVVVFADHDAKPDGSDPGLKHANKVRSMIPGAVIVTPPAGFDVSDWIAAEGADAVAKAAGLS